ncbi:helix-turn-helix domain-containing protein [Candidatus Bathyarchaeota archaeon]|nr:helix-turn-helix domain-containing protein [Candidatus Bathyarchaeota archaeon]
MKDGPERGLIVTHFVKARIYPTVAQEKLLAKTLGCNRWIWNHWL